jgi:hypothetical protein
LVLLVLLVILVLKVLYVLRSLGILGPFCLFSLFGLFGPSVWSGQDCRARLPDNEWVWWCGGVFSPLALEHSKVCTLCDFGHLHFFNIILIAYGQQKLADKLVVHILQSRN